MTYYEMREDAAFLLNMGSQCPLWVISGHTDKSAPCPRYPQMLIVSINVCYVPEADVP